MLPDIQAIFLDLGNTLRILVKDENYQAQARKKIVDLTGTDESPATFCERLESRYKEYRKWAFENLIEASEVELWTRWLAPEYPAEKITPLAVELTYQFRQAMGRRVVQPGCRKVLEELIIRGYILGIISNVITSREIPEWLEKENYASYFKSVVLSSLYGRRKPDPAIYLEAARLASVAPEHCVYVGDNPKRDVVGTRLAGFGMVILMIDSSDLDASPPTGENLPDRVIHTLDELLDVFPPRFAVKEDRSFASTWSMQNVNHVTHPERGGAILADAVRRLYRQGQTDYSLDPVVLADQQGQPVGRIKDSDAVIFCCRRGDREIQLTEAFVDPEFTHFPRQKIHDLDFVILTLYHEKFKDLPVAFAPFNFRDTLGEVVSRASLSQLRVAESEKFAHVTFFLNGGSHQVYAGEEDRNIPSPKGIPMDQVPELSLAQVAGEVLRGIEQKYHLIITNFANGDVIGHTQNRQAKIQCAEEVDAQLSRVVNLALNADYVVFVTADHGNLEEMTCLDGTPHVAHTSNPVPFIWIDPRIPGAFKNPTGYSVRNDIISGSLADIAPTVLSAMGLPKPETMLGHNLIDEHNWGEPRRALLIILDGWGLGKQDDTNPIYLGQTPFWDQLLERYPCWRLEASGESVGLEPGKPGNSEAGHMNIGAGRVVLQDDVRLDRSLKDGSFYQNAKFLHTIEAVKQRGSCLHLIGLLTEKSSHGSIEYPLALLQIAKEKKLDNVYLHVIFDGRSTLPGSAPDLLEKLDEQLEAIGLGKIVTGIGRGLALDRDGNYAKIQRAYEAFVNGVGHRSSHIDKPICNENRKGVT